jgi:mannose-6-phosphate isomerase-like protein (cupin superfamily)
MIKEIKANNDILATIIDHRFSNEGISFFTPDESPQQLAFMKHATGKKISPHIHNSVKREIYYTNEVLLIRKGRLRVDFYDNSKTYIESHILTAGDIVILTSGGHGFTVIEDLEMFEVKQGPYVGELDKVRFDGINDSDIIYKD